MAADILGWCGKTLRIDLSSLTVTELNTVDYVERYPGGRGVATRIYYDEAY